MGRGMARNLHKHGLLQGVWNRTRVRADELAAELQVAAPATPAELAASCNVVVVCVSADADVLAMVDALAPGLKPGSLVIDCSTVGAGTAREAAQRLALRGCEFIDAPVSGGVEGARDGTLAIMCGGSESAVAQARPVLEAMGRTVTHFGPTGMGQAAKATNQIMVAGVIRAVAEGLAFANAHGLPLDRTIATLSQGAGGSWYLANRGPFMERDAYPPGFRVRLHEKDLRICRAMALAVGASLPVVDDLLAEYALLIAQGHGDEDISVLYRLKRALFEGGHG